MEQSRGQVRVEQSPTRCPYCHADLEEKDLEAAVVCQRCLSRHHSECWLGGCASCKTTQALAPATRPPSSGDPTAGYERAKRFINRAFAVSVFLILPASMIMMAAPHLEWLVTPLIVGLCVITGLSSFVVAVYDVIVRKMRDPRTEWLAVAVAFLGACTGGFASFAYYLRWGREPLPPPPLPIRPTVADAARAKGEVP